MYPEIEVMCQQLVVNAIRFFFKLLACTTLSVVPIQFKRDFRSVWRQQHQPEPAIVTISVLVLENKIIATIFFFNSIEIVCNCNNNNIDNGLHPSVNNVI